MATLYNCHTDGDQWRITKFSDHGEVESSYLCTETECECPAGVRPSCRHRDMLPKFIQRGFINDFHFYDFDRGGWVTSEPANLRQQLADSVAPEGLTPKPESSYELVDEDEVEIIEPSAIMGNGLPHLAGVYAKNITPAPDPDDYGEDPIGLESLPPQRPAWRRI